MRPAESRTHDDLDLLLPQYDFAERHRRLIPAEPEQIWDALSTLTLTDLRLTRPLVWVRGLGGHRRDADKALFTDGPVTMLIQNAPWYALGGAVSRPWKRQPDRRPIATLEEFRAFDEPGWATYLTDFRLHPVADGTVLSTETRVRCTDSTSRRRFAPYWALIRPFSGLVRRDILATADRQAAQAAGPPNGVSGRTTAATG